MIKKIDIGHFGVFENYRWDIGVDKNNTPLYFSDTNIIYGQNYSGKTTLSKIFGALENKVIPTKYSNPQFSVTLTDNATPIDETNFVLNTLDVRVFNEDFMRENLKFLYDDNCEIKPFAILGANNTKGEAEIKEIEKELGLNELGKETELYLKKIQLAKTSTEAMAAFSKASSDLEKKLKDKAQNIKTKHSRFGDHLYDITKIRKEIDLIVINYNPLTVEKIANLDKTINEQMKEEDPPQLGIEKFAYEEICRQAEEILKTTVGASDKIKSLLEDVALSSWVKSGIVLHRKEKQTCLFCDNKIEASRWEAINGHFDEESLKLESGLDSLTKKISEEITLLSGKLNIQKNSFYASYHGQLDELVGTYEKEAPIYINALKNILDQITKKRLALTKELVFIMPSFSQYELDGVLAKYLMIISVNKTYSDTLEQNKKDARNNLRKQEIYEFIETIDFVNLKKDLAKLETQKADLLKSLEEITKIIGTKELQLKMKRRELNDEEKGAQLVNKYLSNHFGHATLNLQAEKVEEGEPRIEFKIYRKNEPAYNLSGGEQNLIAFCYFIAKLNDTDTTGRKPIIWIDDPISSLDNNNIFFVFSLIATELIKDVTYKQMFISTHNLDFLRYLMRLKLKPTERRYLMIRSETESRSTITAMPQYLSKYVTEFNFHFSEINRCAQIANVTDDNFKSLYNLGNNMRKFMETLMYFYFPSETMTDLEKMEKFFGEGKTPAVLTNRINNEYSHLKNTFEKGMTPIEQPELLKTARLIINTLNTKYPDQYSALIQSTA